MGIETKSLIKKSVFEFVLRDNKTSTRFLGVIFGLTTIIGLVVYFLFFGIYTTLYDTLDTVEIKENSIVINSKNDNSNTFCITSVPSGNTHFIRTGVYLNKDEKANISASGLVNLCLERTVFQIHSDGFPKYEPANPDGNKFSIITQENSIRDSCRKKLLLMTCDTIGQLVIYLSDNTTNENIFLEPAMNLKPTIKGYFFSYKNNKKLKDRDVFQVTNHSEDKREILLAVNDICLSKATPNLDTCSRLAYIGTNTTKPELGESLKDFLYRRQKRSENFSTIIEKHPYCFYGDNLGDFTVTIQKEKKPAGLFKWFSKN